MGGLEGLGVLAVERKQKWRGEKGGLTPKPVIRISTSSSVGDISSVSMSECLTPGSPIFEFLEKL